MKTPFTCWSATASARTVLARDPGEAAERFAELTGVEDTIDVRGPDGETETFAPVAYEIAS